jgi:predicted esterase
MQRLALACLVVVACAAASLPAHAAQPPADGLVRLAVPGFGEAVVSLPRGSFAPEPVMVAAHGHGTDPEGMCREMRLVAGDSGFIVCPRGVPVAQGGYGFDARFPAEVEAAVAALRAHYLLWVALGPMAYAGYSQGAYEAPPLIMKHPGVYSRVLLIEGGQQGWDPQRFASAGGQRVLFACGQAPCDAGARASAARFERAGVPSKVLYCPGAGHIFWGPVSASIKSEWAWFVAGDPRWSHAPWWTGANARLAG